MYIYSTSYKLCHPLANQFPPNILVQREAAKYIFGAELMFLSAGLRPGILWSGTFDAFLYGGGSLPALTPLLPRRGNICILFTHTN